MSRRFVFQLISHVCGGILLNLKAVQGLLLAAVEGAGLVAHESILDIAPFLCLLRACGMILVGPRLAPLFLCWMLTTALRHRWIVLCLRQKSEVFWAEGIVRNVGLMARIRASTDCFILLVNTLELGIQCNHLSPSCASFLRLA